METQTGFWQTYFPTIITLELWVSMGFQVNFIASWVVKLSLAMGASFLEVFFLYMVSHKLFSFELFVTTLTINRRRVSSSFVESHFVSCQKSLVTVRFFANEVALMKWDDCWSLFYCWNLSVHKIRKVLSDPSWAFNLQLNIFDKIVIL